MDHSPHFEGLLKNLKLTIDQIEIGKEKYSEYGYFTQTYMPILIRIKPTPGATVQLTELLEHIDFVEDLLLSKQTEFRCLQRTIEVHLFYCEIAPEEEFIMYTNEYENLRSRVYEQFKICDCR